VFAPGFPGLEEVRSVVRNPARVAAARFDEAGFAQNVVFLARFLPGPAFLDLLYTGLLGDDRNDRENQPPDDSGDAELPPPPPPILEETFPPPQDENPPSCPRVTLTFDPIGVAEPEIQNLRGLEELLRSFVELQVLGFRLLLLTLAVPNTIAGMMLPDSVRAELERVRQRLQSILPLPPGLDVPMNLTIDQVIRGFFALLQQVRDKITDIQNTRIVPREFDLPRNIVTQRTAVNVQAPADTRLRLRFVSRMESTYSYGVGAGTQYAFAPGEDRPWFGKVLIRPNRVVQLGAEGARDTQEGDIPIQIPRTGRAALPLFLDGNYGALRVFASSEDGRCLYASGLFRVRGAFEDAVVQAENVRFEDVEDTLDKIETIVDAFDDLVDTVLAALQIIPAFGAGAAFFIQAAKVILKGVTTFVVLVVRNVNQTQRGINLRAAAIFPERGPVGLLEDDLPD
jgi:hypothetical protein